MINFYDYYYLLSKIFLCKFSWNIWNVLIYIFIKQIFQRNALWLKRNSDKLSISDDKYRYDYNFIYIIIIIIKLIIWNFNY